MSSKKKIGIVIVVAVLAITFMTVAFLTTQTNTDYYTQIDNRWVTDIAPHGAMNYKYTLVAYDESGNAKDVTFETSKVLTDGAYLCLKVAPIRGVVTWAEMQFDELPLMLSRLVDTFFSRTSWTMLLYAENHSISVA